MQTFTHTQTEIWMMAACFSRFPFPRAAKALEAPVIPSASICIVSKILEQKLWPFNVKGRSAQICVDGGQPLPIYLQSLCPVPIVNFMRCRTSCFQGVADSKSSSIQCTMLCIVSHEISTALPRRNVKRLFAILNTKSILLPELQYQGLFQKEGLYPGSPGQAQL